MGNPYVQKETSKIFQDYEYPKNAALAAAWIMAHYKGINLKIFQAEESTSLCDYNIIGSAENTVQAKTMIDEIQEALKKGGCELISLEGVSDGDWILLDMGDVIIHVFQDLSRDYFDLDSLWEDQEQLAIPQEFYFSHQSDVQETGDNTENYF